MPCLRSSQNHPVSCSVTPKITRLLAESMRVVRVNPFCSMKQPLMACRFAPFWERVVGLLLCLILFGCTHADAQTPADSSKGQIAEFSGPTMGTRFTVKIFEPPNFEEDVRLEVDALLRRINDQMSTYLPKSEISRFNDSESLDWFPVSLETATVTQFAQTLAEKTGGAFDVTIEPLVNAWSFGPKERKRVVPTEQEIKQLLEEIGYEKLQVRLDPPALKKSVPQLEIDLSSVAKGYAVDRVVAKLNELGAENVFVEIGGEVCTSGDKAGMPWQVGIQVPDMIQEAILLAQPLNTMPASDQAMATSGDYRNYFEVDGIRYSHTIDPRSGRPIEHGLASISVIASSCMEADAWATAINVVGEKAGVALAEAEGLSILAVQRIEDRYEYVGTGLLADHAANLSQNVSKSQSNSQSTASETSQKNSQVASSNGSGATIILTALVLGLIIAGMAIGVIFGRRSISGSCGGLANRKDADGNTSCALCSSPSDACKELRERMNEETTKTVD